MTKNFKIILAVFLTFAAVACPVPVPPAPAAPVLFGGNVLVMGAIDENGDHMPDNGEWSFFLNPSLTMAGNAVVDFNYPADFSQLVNCGTVEVTLSGAGAQAGKTVYCDGVSVSGGNPNNRTGRGSGVISGGGNANITLQNMGIDWKYGGGMQFPLWIYIDVNGNSVCDNGDYFHDTAAITVNGNMTIPVVLGDFAVVANSGTLTLRITGAAAVHAGKAFIGGTRYPLTMTNGTISTNPQDFIFLKNGSPFVFMGGTTFLGGGIIDVDGNSIDDGDWMTGGSMPINGNTIVTKAYPADFTQITGMGTITVNINGANALHAGKPLVIQVVPTQGGTTCYRYTTVTSDAVSVTFNTNDLYQE